MGTISNYVYVNPVEPGPLSLRVHSGIETRVDLTYFDNAGGPITTDLLGQVQVLGRSQGSPMWFTAPATDVVNGKARFVLPAGQLTDLSGYHLRLYGTVEGQLMVLAMGKIDVMPASALPGAINTIDSINLTLDRGEAALIGVKLWVDTGKGQPYDITNSIVSAAIYESQGGPQIVPFATTVISANEVELSLTANQVDQLPDLCWWNLVSATTGVGMITLAEGQVTVSGIVLAPFLANYNYAMPDLADPLPGEIVHCNFTRNVLAINKVDADGLPQPDLAHIGVNDTIAIGAQIWTVQAATEAFDWWEYKVAPVVQLASAGLYAVNFASASA